MKIAITIELDKETTELFQVPFKKILKQINNLMGMFEKVEVNTESDPEPDMNVDPDKNINLKSDLEFNSGLETKKNFKTKTSKSQKYQMSITLSGRRQLSWPVF